jgi:hypothetical protein
LIPKGYNNPTGIVAFRSNLLQEGGFIDRALNNVIFDKTDGTTFELTNETRTGELSISIADFVANLLMPKKYQKVLSNIIVYYMEVANGILTEIAEKNDYEFPYNMARSDVAQEIIDITKNTVFADEDLNYQKNEKYLKMTTLHYDKDHNDLKHTKFYDRSSKQAMIDLQWEDYGYSKY